MADAGNGFRPTDPGEGGSTTCWPSLLALASTWNRKVVRKVAESIGDEFAGKGANVILGPSVNVHRIAANGRNFEYVSGEDPTLGAKLTTEYVKGVQSKGVMAVVKHYAFNEQETNRMGQDSIIDDRTAWELYYPPFEAAVKAGAGGFMCSYNRVNGTYACESPELLQRDLKQKMGFDGIVMSDWGATHSTKAVANGLDQEMPGKPYFESAEAEKQMAYFGISASNFFTDHGLASKEFEKSTLDAATHVLQTIYRLGLDKQDSCTPPACKDRRLSDQTSEEHRGLAASAATEAVVMLQNNGVLPLESSKVKTIAVIGQGADHVYYMAGGGSGSVPMKYSQTAYDSILEHGVRAGIKVVRPTTAAGYERWIKGALDADVVVVVAGTYATEGADRKSLTLDTLHEGFPETDQIIADIAGRKPTVVMMLTPGVVLTPWREKTAAIMNLFLGGEEAGTALASVLFGEVSPSGKSPVMFPSSEKDAIAPGADGKVPYSEGLFTSYRSPTLKAAFPFGHGLSYTTFEYGEPLVMGPCKQDTTHCVRVSVKNTGDRPGAEVVQAYLSFWTQNKHDAERATEDEIKATPERFLRDFGKTRVLQPGETEVVQLAFSTRDLSIYRPGQGWVVQNDVIARIGSSSTDVRHTVSIAS